MGEQGSFGWVLGVLGLVLVGLGLLQVLLPSVPWPGRLPGDIRVEQDNVRFYPPVITCLLLSLVAALVLWLVRALRG